MIISVLHRLRTEQRGVGQQLADAYEIRVIADGGIYENNDCLVAALNNLDSI